RRTIVSSRRRLKLYCFGGMLMNTRDSLARAAVVAAVALFILSRPGFAQDQPEPQILLGRVGETYRNLKSYRFELSIVTESRAKVAQQVESESRSKERVLLA